MENKHRPQLIITFNKLKENGLFKEFETYEMWENRNKPKQATTSQDKPKEQTPFNQAFK